MNPDEQLSEHFVLREFLVSQTAARRGYKNIPSEAAIQALRVLAVEVLEPIRVIAGGPLMVSSGYRSPEINRAVGGSANSQHCRGEAADILCPRMSAAALFKLVKASGIVADQIILEFEEWLHISFTRRYPNRTQYLIATKRGGNTVYQHLR